MIECTMEYPVHMSQNDTHDTLMRYVGKICSKKFPLGLLCNLISCWFSLLKHSFSHGSPAFFGASKPPRPFYK